MKPRSRPNSKPHSNHKVQKDHRKPPRTPTPKSKRPIPVGFTEDPDPSAPPQQQQQQQQPKSSYSKQSYSADYSHGGNQEQKVSYGEKVKRRRLQAAAELDESLSVSKRRKLVRQQEAEVRQPAKIFERECGKGYDALLRTIKRKEEAQPRVQKLLDLIFGPDAPLAAVKADADVEEINRIYNKQIISRSIQQCLRAANEEQKAFLQEKLTGEHSKTGCLHQKRCLRTHRTHLFPATQAFMTHITVCVRYRSIQQACTDRSGPSLMSDPIALC